MPTPGTHPRAREGGRGQQRVLGEACWVDLKERCSLDPDMEPPRNEASAVWPRVERHPFQPQVGTLVLGGESWRDLASPRKSGPTAMRSACPSPSGRRAAADGRRHSPMESRPHTCHPPAPAASQGTDLQSQDRPVPTPPTPSTSGKRSHSSGPSPSRLPPGFVQAELVGLAAGKVRGFLSLH